MSNPNFKIWEWLAALSTFFLFILSLLYCCRKATPPYLRIFPVYCFLNILSEVLAYLLPSFQDVIYFLFTIFELLFFSFFFSSIIRRKAIVISLWILNGTFIGVLVHYLWRHRIIPFGLPEEGESLILLLPCLVCFIQIFTHSPASDLRQDPFFWMVTGVLFYIVLLFPTLLFTQYYYNAHRPDLAKQFFSINSVAVIVSNFSYAKGITCWQIK